MDVTDVFADGSTVPNPKLGTLTWGLTGRETVQELDLITPSHIFTVSEPNISIPQESKEGNNECP